MAINPGCCRSASEKAGSEAQKGDEIMLDIYMMPEGEKSREIVKRHVNERLLKILDRAIKDYVMIFDDKRRYWKRITCSEDWEKSVDELFDLKQMEKDGDFFFWMQVAYLAPATSTPLSAAQAFFALRRLLQEKGEYKPDLTEEYVLYALIRNELDYCKDLPESGGRVIRIPEPDRNIVLEDVLAEAAGDKEFEPELYENKSVEQIAEDLMGYDEDLGNYVMTCFEDEDFLMLDFIDAKAMKNTLFAQTLGINTGEDDVFTRPEGEDDEDSDLPF